jgi:transcriptional regulator with XRE-family HTH domain
MHELLAAGVKAARQARGWTQEEAARRFRFHGLTTWRTGTVGQMEAGLRHPRLDEVILICAALGVTLEQLLPGTDEHVELGNGAVMTPPAIRMLLAGDYAENVRQQLDGIPYEHFPGEVAAAQDLAGSWAERDRQRVLIQPILSRTTLDPYSATVHRVFLPPADAEANAARRLKVEPVQLKVASLVLWGRDFTEERDERAGDPGDAAPDTVQALRGHATRAMLAELGAFLDKAYADQPGELGSER